MTSAAAPARTHSLEVLGRQGHLTLTWDEADPAAVAEARAEVARLRDAGYAFFLVDDTPADEVAAGRGTLRCRRVDAPPGLDVVAPPDPPVEPEASEPPVNPRRGRALPHTTRTVAVRPQAGG